MSTLLNSVISTIGTRPSTGDIAIYDWFQRLIRYRNAETPLYNPGQITYFFSSSGNDANDGRSMQTAKASISGFQSLITSLRAAGATGNYRFRFRAMPDKFVWYDSLLPGICVTGWNKISIDSYFDPTVNHTSDQFRVSAFRGIDEIKAAGSGWVQVSGTCYRIGINASYRPWWIKDNDDHLTRRGQSFNLYSEADSLAEVCSTTGMWIYIPNQLLVNTHGGTHPSGSSIEVTYSDADAIAVGAADNQRVERACAEGFGIGNQDLGYGIKCYDLAGSNACVFDRLSVWYTGNHGIGMLNSSASSSGGIMTFLGCSGGLMRPASNGETFYIAYSYNGRHEHIFDRCEGTYGTMMGSGYKTSSRGRSVYAHNIGGAAITSFGLAIDCRTNTSGFTPYSNFNAFAGFGNTRVVASGGSIDECSGFIVNDIADFYNHETSVSFFDYGPGICVINPRITSMRVAGARPTLYQLGNNVKIGPTYFINPVLSMLFVSGNNQVGFYGQANGVATTGAEVHVDWYHGTINFSGNITTDFGGGTIGFSVAPSTHMIGTALGINTNNAARYMRAYNTAFSAGTGTLNATRNMINLYNATPGTSGIFGGMSCCAFYNMTPSDYTSTTGIFCGYNRSTGYVNVTSYIYVQVVPPITHPMANMAGPLPSGYTINYDNRWHPRSNNMIGAYDPTRMTTMPSGRANAINGPEVSSYLFRNPPNDLSYTIVRRTEQDFDNNTTTVKTGTIHYHDLKFIDSAVKQDGLYTYIITYTDLAGETYQDSFQVPVGNLANKALSSNWSNQTANSFRRFDDSANIADNVPMSQYQSSQLVSKSSRNFISIKGFIFGRTTATAPFTLIDPSSSVMNQGTTVIKNAGCGGISLITEGGPTNIGGSMLGNVGS